LLGVDAGVNKPADVEKAEQETANLTPKQRAVQEEAERRRKNEEVAEQELNRVGRNAMMGYKVNDFIKTSDGKLIIPSKEDTLVGLKTDGPLDKFFKSTIKNSEEGNSILKKYAEISSNMLAKQLQLLNDNNKLLGELTQKMSTPTNIVSKPTVIRNNFGLGGDLRAIQGVNSATN